MSFRIKILKNGNFCKDIKPYDSLVDVDELRNRDWHFERLIRSFEDEKDEIQKKIIYATNSSVEERYEKSDSFSIGKEFEFLTDTFLVIFGDVIATTESFEKGINRL